MAGKSRRKPRAVNDDMATPTPEQLAGARFDIDDVTDKRRGGGTISIGKAYRRRPMIDILFGQGVFNEPEFKALRHYRHHADMADRSPLRDSLRNLLRIAGAGMPPSHATLNAIRVRDDCERAAGSLRDILRAVVVDDVSLSQWAMSRFGSREKCREANGKRHCWLEPTRSDAVSMARVEIRIAAQRVQAELDA